jgi:hypothetical protein
MKNESTERMNDFLDRVKSILGNRSKEYGPPLESFERIARAWSETMGCEITPVRACQLMIDLKIARLRNDPTNVDSMIDIIGYTCCLHELAASNKKKPDAVCDVIFDDCIPYEYIHLCARCNAPIQYPFTYNLSEGPSCHDCYFKQYRTCLCKQ